MDRKDNQNSIRRIFSRGDRKIQMIRHHATTKHYSNEDKKKKTKQKKREGERERAKRVFEE